MEVKMGPARIVHTHVWGTAKIVEAPSGHEDEVGELYGLCVICGLPESPDDD